MVSSSNFLVMKFSKDDKIMFCMVGAMCFLLAIGMLLPHGNASVLEDMKSELKYDYMPLEREPQILEDEFEICSFEKECFTLPADDIFDDETIEKIWMRFQYDLDTYPRD